MIFSAPLSILRRSSRQNLVPCPLPLVPCALNDVDRLADRHRPAGDRGELLFAGATEAARGSGGGMIGAAKNFESNRS